MYAIELFEFPKDIPIALTSASAMPLSITTVMLRYPKCAKSDAEGHIMLIYAMAHFSRLSAGFLFDYNFLLAPDRSVPWLGSRYRDSQSDEDNPVIVVLNMCMKLFVRANVH